MEKTKTKKILVAANWFKIDEMKDLLKLFYHELKNDLIELEATDDQIDALRELGLIDSEDYTPEKVVNNRWSEWIQAPFMQMMKFTTPNTFIIIEPDAALNRRFTERIKELVPGLVITEVSGANTEFCITSTSDLEKLVYHVMSEDYLEEIDKYLVKKHPLAQYFDLESLALDGSGYPSYHFYCIGDRREKFCIEGLSRSAADLIEKVIKLTNQSAGSPIQYGYPEITSNSCIMWFTYEPERVACYEVIASILRYQS